MSSLVNTLAGAGKQLLKLERRWLVGLALAQGCALMSASSAIASEALVSRGANFPAWQSFFMYVLLGGCYVPVYARQRYRDSQRQGAVLRSSDHLELPGPSGGVTTPPPPTPSGYSSSPIPLSDSSAATLAANVNSGSGTGSTRTPWRYVMLAVIDTQANYCIVKSFQYTSLTSVTLLDCAAIPFSMALSVVLLGSKYTYKHVAGGVVSFAGLAILMFSDASDGDDRSGRANPVLGDFLVLLAAALYASSNVMQEVLLLDGAPTTEVLAAVGGIGVIVSGLQCLTFEFSQLNSLGGVAGVTGVGEVAAFAIFLFAMYSLVPDVLRRCGAAAFNISMLSADLWAVIARVTLFGGFTGAFSALAFAASFVTVSVGLVLFAAAGDPLPAERKGGREARYFEILDELEEG